jgi:hypothetical protein
MLGQWWSRPHLLEVISLRNTWDYHHLVARGRKLMSALMVVMRKMVAVATHLMKTGEDYDRSLVWVSLTS